VRISLGEPELAIKHFSHAMRLSPFDPLLNRMQAGIATAHFFAGRYDEASSWAEKALRERPDYQSALRVSAASNALAGRLKEARKSMAAIRQSDPTLRISTLEHRLPLQRPEDFARWCEAMRIAGLPE
jgi:tetratricopeptide (TPR) repeat protein